MTALPLTSVFLIGSRRSFRLVERNLYVYRHGWLVLLSGFFEPLFYLLGVGFGIGTLFDDPVAALIHVTYLTALALVGGYLAIRTISRTLVRG